MWTWAYLPIAGLAFDVVGAMTVAASLVTMTPRVIADAVPIRGRGAGAAMFDRELSPGTPGLPEVARGFARQRAEARLGVALLVVGFVLQGVGYLFPAAGKSLSTWGERGIALVIWLAIGVLAFGVYRGWVARSTQRTFDTADAFDALSLGQAPTR